MSFVEEQFPPDISFNATGGPAFSTDIVSSFSGHEQRNANWGEARMRWNVAHAAVKDAQRAALIAFYRARSGRAVGFRFKDWSDYQVSAGVIGTGDGAQTTFQLRKEYASAGIIVQRPITKPVAGTVTIYVDGAVEAGAVVDTTTGIVTLPSAPANGAVITADCEFDVPARFDTDQMLMSLSSWQTSGWNDIPIVELRV